MSLATRLKTNPDSTILDMYLGSFLQSVIHNNEHLFCVKLFSLKHLYP